MSLTIYGYAQSRTFRTLWMAEELRIAKGVRYVHDGRIFSSNEERSLLLSLNPMGKVPVIDQEGFVLHESMAINLYLARKYDCLAPKSLEQEALAWQWSFWVMTSVDSHLLDCLRYTLGILGATKDDQRAAQIQEQLDRPFTVLNGELAKSAYLLGDEFSVADLNVASVFAWARVANLPMSHLPSLDDWLTRCMDRPATRATNS